MRVPPFLYGLAFLVACTESTSPSPETASTRTVTPLAYTSYFDNPCTGEGVTATTTGTVTLQTSGSIDRYGAFVQTTGIGDLGTTFSGQFHVGEVTHSDGLVSAHFTDLLHGSDGSAYSFVGAFTVDRDGVTKLDLYQFRCL